MATGELACRGPSQGDRLSSRGRRVWLGLLMAAGIAAVSGCAGSTSASQIPGSAASASADAPPSGEEERSVRPGVNDRYFRPGTHDRWERMFTREKREVFEHRQQIVDDLGLSRGLVVADIGAGTGVFTALLADAVGDEGHVYAIDLVPSFLADLRAIAEQRANVEVIVATPRASGLEERSIDLAFLCDVYHHLEYPQTYMADLRRALRPGGRVVLIDFHRIEGVTSDPMLKHVRAGRETVVAELEQAGFVVVGEVAGLRENYGLVLQPR